MRLIGIVLTALLALAGDAPQVEAHGMYVSYAQIAVTPSRLEAVYLLSVDEIGRHFRVAPGPVVGAGQETVEQSLPAVSAFLADHAAVALDGRRVALQPVSYRPHANGAFIRFEFSQAFERRPSTVSVAADAAFFERLGQQHVMLVTLDVEGRTQEGPISNSQPQTTFPTGYRAPLAQATEFVQLGIRHILHGYDHLVFLLAVVIIGGSLRSLVKIVTAFTVAHSVTLALAVFQIVTLPPRLVEGGIALSIAYVAFDNFFATASAHRWILTFGFGLIHGFGFANLLAEMNLPRSVLAPALLSFNAGVEAGQLAVVAVLFPAMLWLARQRFRQAVVLATSVVTFLFGTGWFIQRAFEN
jgi:hypothetical protein